MTTKTIQPGDTLRVVHAVPGVWLPPTQTWLYHQMRCLPASIEPHVVCDRTDNLEQFAMPRVRAVADLPPWSRRLDGLQRRARLRRHRGLLADVLAETAAPVLHSHFGTEGCRNRALAARQGVRHVVTFYGYDVNCLPQRARWRRRYARLFRDVDLVLGEGPHMAACIRNLECPAERVRVHHLGVDLTRIPFRPRAWGGGEPLRVLLAAAFREKKGLPLAIEALGRLRRDVDLRITIIGDTTTAPGSTEEKARILAAIDRHDLHDCVTLRGFQPHDVLTQEAQHHHLHVAPSRTAPDGDTEGGAPVSLIEMAASGMPIVSTRHCDIPGIIRHGHTGFLARENDADDLLAQLRAMLDHAPHWSDMLTAARHHIEANFNAKTQGARLAEIYEAIAKGHALTPQASSLKPHPSSLTPQASRLKRHALRLTPPDDIDILVITHERPVYTRRALDRLLATCDDRMRVWLWHNGMHAATLALVQKYAEHPRVHAFFHSRENRKLDEPTRWMWGKATGAYLSKVDDDCLMPDGWAETLRAAHAAEPRFGVLGCWRFQDEDFVPELAERKISTYGGGHRILGNCWVEGSGYLMKRACLESTGTLREGEGFTRYCQRVAARGWINGWYYPFLRQEHMDDPRARHTLLRTDADLAAHAPLSARHRGVRTIDEWVAQLHASARVVQEAPTDPRLYIGMRKRVRRTLARARGERLVY